MHKPTLTTVPPKAVRAKKQKAIAVAGGKGKGKGGRKAAPKKGGKDAPTPDPPKIVCLDSTIRDFSNSSAALIKDKFLLGDRYSVQIGEVSFSGVRRYCYEAIIFTREGVVDEDEAKAKKPFKFNIPSKLLVPLCNALQTIIKKSERVADDM